MPCHSGESECTLGIEAIYYGSTGIGYEEDMTAQIYQRAALHSRTSPVLKFPARNNVVIHNIISVHLRGQCNFGKQSVFKDINIS